MPNHVINHIRIEGSDSDLKAIRKLVKTEENDFDFNSLVPMPAEIGTDPIQLGKEKTAEEKAKSKELIEKYGYDNWYEWSLANWGTKWNAYRVEDRQESINSEGKLTALTYQFQTAWSMPEGFAIALSKRFPKVVIYWEFADEDLGYNCGTKNYEGGKETFSKVYDGDGEDFANALWGWEEDEDEDEDEEDHDNYPSQDKISISKRKDTFGDYEYSIKYDSGDWAFTGTKEEVLEELSEHFENMLAD